MRFNADIIEPLCESDSFFVDKPDGIFHFTKVEFYCESHFRKYANPNNIFVLPKENGYLGDIDVLINEQKRKLILLLSVIVEIESA